MYMKITHVHDVSFVTSTIVTALNEIGVKATFYEFINWKIRKSPKIIQFILTSSARFVEIFRFKSIVHKGKFDVIHIHYGTFAYLAFFSRIPFYLHIHGTDVRTHVNWPLIGNVIRWGIINAEKVFYSTPDLKPIVEKFRRDAIFFPNPINTDQFFVKKFDEKCDLVSLFNINKLDRFKGTNNVLKSIQLIWEIFPNLNVKMFQFGNSIKDAEEFLVKYQNVPNLSFLPRISHEKMVDELQNSSIILGQLGTGILTCSELEAMSCGKPVICNFKYFDMYPEPPPVLVANTPEEVRDQIVFLLNNPEEGKKIGEKAREWVVKYYDYRKVAQKLLNIYLENKK